jgi:hypothetical protein
LETALDAEMTEHLGYEKHDPAGCGSGSRRTGTIDTASAGSLFLPGQTVAEREQEIAIRCTREVE